MLTSFPLRFIVGYVHILTKPFYQSWLHLPVTHILYWTRVGATVSASQKLVFSFFRLLGSRSHYAHLKNP